jgi:23S rRNA (cytidine2498-2'-O)-methyltransferase
VHDRLVIARGAAVQASWAENTWLEPIEIPISSISDGARKLREMHPRWALFSTQNHRRAQLIQEQLPRLKNPPLDFSPSADPTDSPAIAKLKPGSWTLLEPQLILASPHCTSPFPNGEVTFNEDREQPPSRAYLKLWELFTVHGVRPRPQDLCLDLGSSPGGWTWVLHEIGARVISVDKAPLDPRIEKLPRVDYRRASAFTLEPDTIGAVDWLFSDIICAPEKLFDLVMKWRASGLVSNFACTIKFKGATDHATTRRFEEIPGSRVVHLHHNKHELTWVNLKSST